MATVTYDDYAEQIKAIVKQASAEGTAFTPKDIERIVREAYDEMAAETARKLYGNAR